MSGFEEPPGSELGVACGTEWELLSSELDVACGTEKLMIGVGIVIVVKN
jgi:hypothetical protein